MRGMDKGKVCDKRVRTISPLTAQPLISAFLVQWLEFSTGETHQSSMERSPFGSGRRRDAALGRLWLVFTL